MTTTIEDCYSDADIAAFNLAIQMTLAEDDSSRVEQVESMLAERPHLDVARFCCYHQQMKTLSLRPWQSPPCWLVLDEDETPQPRHRDGVRLLHRMRSHGVSDFHPSPIEAIADAKAATR